MCTCGWYRSDFRLGNNFALILMRCHFHRNRVSLPVAWTAMCILPIPELGLKSILPGLTPGTRQQTYRTARQKLNTASSVQTTIPANDNRLTRVDQEDFQIQSTTIMGRKNTQTMISVTVGKVRTQFQSKSSHSRFATSAIANPIHSIAKITIA